MASKHPRLQCPLCKENISYSAVSRHTQARSCQYTSRSSDSSELDNLASDIHDATTSDQGLNSVTVCQDSLDPAELSDSSIEEQSEVELAPEIWEADSNFDNDVEMYKSFSYFRFSDATDYKGFDREMWPLRDIKNNYTLT